MKPPSGGSAFCGELTLALYYHPKQGDVLLCDFTRGFVAPEMLKIRKVVPRLCADDMRGVVNGVKAYLPL
ncbi:hypothetical protein J1G33_08830 [Pseudomonas sp. P867]|uniref:hypothetical protein n=1 Tax=Pseudomonas sp. P867 TaxID=2816050 RepID=UPI001CA5F4A2|nr:hypothetical protein [Pseudomonas sp. P867]MBY8970498.1 hypothetical protein [Pseudomonas sp. P867]